jgi:hypothetical protein
MAGAPPTQRELVYVRATHDNSFGYAPAHTVSSNGRSERDSNTYAAPKARSVRTSRYSGPAGVTYRAPDRTEARVSSTATKPAKKPAAASRPSERSVRADQPAIDVDAKRADAEASTRATSDRGVLRLPASKPSQTGEASSSDLRQRIERYIESVRDERARERADR